MYSEETKPSNLAKLLNNFDKVFMDTCSLMEDSFPQFMDCLVKSHEYWKDGLKVIVLGECMEELKKHSKSKDGDKFVEAKLAIKILEHNKRHGKTIEITKPTHKDGFADRAIFAKVTDLRIAEKILIITQDKKLTNDIRGLNGLESQKGRNIHVYRISRNGDLEINYGEKPQERAPARINKTPIKTKQEAPKKAPEKPKTTDKSPVVLADSALSANLSNPNYPSSRKLEDIDKQLALLKACHDSGLDFGIFSLSHRGLGRTICALFVEQFDFVFHHGYKVILASLFQNGDDGSEVVSFGNLGHGINPFSFFRVSFSLFYSEGFSFPSVPLLYHIFSDLSSPFLNFF